MKVELIYNAPVIVVVDTDDERVTLVRVADEEAFPSQSARETATDNDGVPIEDSGVLDRAIAIAENEPWPEWSIG